MDDDVQHLLEKRRYSQALEHLLDRYQNKVFRMAAMMLRDTARAEEVTQEIFLKLWQALPAYDGRAAPSTWLYAIARNTCLSALRSESYRKTVPFDPVHEPPAPEAASNDPEMRQLVERLPAIEREIITLFYWQDKSVGDVARALDLPEGTVKSHLHRGRRALAEMLKE